MKKVDRVFSLFFKSLVNFETKSNERDLPIRLLNPIFIKLEYSLRALNYSNQVIESRIWDLIQVLERKSQKDSNNAVFIMYSVLLVVDDSFRYYLETSDLIIKCSKETLEEEDQKDREEYWLTSWHPSKVVSEDYLKAVNDSYQLWSKCTKQLRESLYNRYHTPPIDDDVNHWDILKGIENM